MIKRTLQIAILFLTLPCLLSAQTLVGPNTMVGPQVIVGGASTGSSIIVVNSTPACNGPSGCTTSPGVNMTGASLCVMAGTAGGTPAFSDSQSNAYVTSKIATNGQVALIKHKYSPSLGSSMTFTTSSGSVDAMCASGTTGSTVDQTATANGASSTSLVVGSVTTSVPELIVVVVELTGSGSQGACTINDGFTILTQANYGTVYGLCAAYKIQSAAGTDNPTMSWANPMTTSVSAVATYF
jgi:hypothetical protein